MGVPLTGLQILWQAGVWLFTAVWDNYSIRDLVVDLREVHGHHITRGAWDSHAAFLDRLLDLLPLASVLIIVGGSIQLFAIVTGPRE